MTNRRSLLGASAATWLGAWLSIANGQDVIRRVALLGVSDGPAPNVDLFRSRLGELGWVEHRNLVLERRFTHGDGARFAPLTAELLALRPDVFVAPFDTMAIAAAASTATVPIVFAAGFDPVGYGLIKSFAHPGRNVTGFSGGGHELGSKILSLLKEAVPGLSVVGVLVGNRDRYKVEYLEETGRRLGLVLVQFELTKPDDIDEAFQAFAKRFPQPLSEREPRARWKSRHPMSQRSKKCAIPRLRKRCWGWTRFGTATACSRSDCPLRTWQE